jgi:hypothetical protein
MKQQRLGIRAPKEPSASILARDSREYRDALARLKTDGLVVGMVEWIKSISASAWRIHFHSPAPLQPNPAPRPAHRPAPPARPAGKQLKLEI